MIGFWLFLGVLEGVGSFGKLVGTISTYPSNYKCPWSRGMAKTPGGGTFSFVAGIVGKLNIIQSDTKSTHKTNGILPEH